MSNKVAFLLRGGISTSSGKLSINENSKKYVNYKSTKISIDKHIIDTNLDLKFDFFIHSWNEDLQDDLISLYNPIRYSFENNHIYYDDINSKLNECNSPLEFYNQASQALSIEKVSKLLIDHCAQNNITYDYVIFYRPDILLWKDLFLDKYDLDNIYCNNYLDGKGDFHFVMSFENFKKFYLIFQNLNINNPPIPHIYIYQYVKNTLNQEILCDNIVAGTDQEVIRKLRSVVEDQKIDVNILSSYNLSLEQINTYTV